MADLKEQSWEVVLWYTQSRSEIRTFATREQAYLFANENHSVPTVEVYGPDGYYDAA